MMLLFFFLRRHCTKEGNVNCISMQLLSQFKHSNTKLGNFLHLNDLRAQFTLSLHACESYWTDTHIWIILMRFTPGRMGGG